MNAYAAPLEKGSKMEELVTKMRVRKGLKVCNFFVDVFCCNSRESVSLKSRLLTRTTTSYNEFTVDMFLIENEL